MRIMRSSFGILSLRFSRIAVDFDAISDFKNVIYRPEHPIFLTAYVVQREITLPDQALQDEFQPIGVGAAFTRVLKKAFCFGIVIAPRGEGCSRKHLALSKVLDVRS